MARLVGAGALHVLIESGGKFVFANRQTAIEARP
jgi:hypothetical protein